MTVRNKAMKTNRLLVLQLSMLATVYACNICESKEEDPFDPAHSSVMEVTGGYVQQISLPQGIEVFAWESRDLTLHFSVQTDKDGKIASVVRYEPDEAIKKPWHEPFTASSIQALGRWKFSPTYDKSGKAIASTFTIHITFKRNRRDECNIVIDTGIGIPYFASNPLFKMD